MLGNAGPRLYALAPGLGRTYGGLSKGATLFLLALLLGCPPASDGKLDSGDTADTADTSDTASDVLDCAEEGECCHAELAPLSMCFETLQTDEVLVGTFDRWAASGEITFTTTAGDVVPLWLSTDAEALSAVPDLAAAGEVTVTQQGGCDGKGGIYAVVHVAGASGDTLFLSGSGPATDLGGWTVEFESSSEACGVREGDACREYAREVPISIRRGDGGTWWQGDEATFGPHYTVRVNSASVLVGELFCDDFRHDYTNYWIIGPG